MNSEVGRSFCLASLNEYYVVLVQFLSLPPISSENYDGPFFNHINVKIELVVSGNFVVDSKRPV